ncbi:unnamed protein product [Rotaria sp. Silwood2]|nr:unnamed protein product [Rotaria sp. Silwood2]CAF3113361.1 unnamed protein product [Rotaria sp. Silwood2]CAF4109304.1 unnamed protein product [Rotaria sp. Silwood2]CAF4128258.1 unnamed protein product [Rotaria sp. Silwood2]CAF4156010.1 unnamed protein product [Rotaria sp. Silwood2]
MSATTLLQLEKEHVKKCKLGHSKVALKIITTPTSVFFIVERSQAFPAISICNYLPIRFENFIEPFLNFTNS